MNIDENELLQPIDDLDDTSDIALKQALNELLGGTDSVSPAMSPGVSPGAPKRATKKTKKAPPAAGIAQPAVPPPVTAPPPPATLQQPPATMPQPSASPDESHIAHPPPVPELHAYPDVKISDRQMEALQSVLGPSAEHKDGLNEDLIKGSSGRGSSGRGSKKKKPSQIPVDLLIEKEDRRSVAKKVTLVIFIILLALAAALGGLYYWWTEHATFEYTLHSVVILEGQNVTASEFLDTVEEMAGISAAFEDPRFEPIAGLQFVPLILSKDLRTLESAAALYVMTPVEYIEHELSEEGSIRPIETLLNPEFAARAEFEVRFTENPLPLEQYPVGDFPLHLALNDAPYIITLRIVDTTPPTATTADQTIKVGDEILPESFITDAFDDSPPITMSFVEEPNVFSREVQTVHIAVTDAFDNTAYYSAELTIEFNQEPPLIEGAPYVIEFELGHPVDYLEGITAHDDFGRELEVQIDDHEIDVETEGTYTAIIFAEDLSGLRTDIEVIVHVITVSPEYVNERVDAILARIIRDGMSQERIIQEIHTWVRRNLSSAEVESDTDSITAAAYRAIDTGKGDSHVYAAISELLLTRAGIENMRIERTPESETEHFWMLVNPDDKGWYHFDAFPTGIFALGNLTHMFTDAQAKDFAERIKTNDGPDNYYTYNPELYPDIVKGDD